MVKKAVVLGTERRERAGNSVHVEKAEISFRENRRHYESLLELDGSWINAVWKTYAFSGFLVAR